MKKKFIGSVLLVGFFVLIFAPINVLAGTASASANAGRKGGQNCGKISKKSRQDTGAMTVTEVKVNGTILTAGRDYNIKAGTSGSTRPIIEFTNPLAANADVSVTLDTVLAGTFTVNLELTTCK